jgi:hypothetical protein
MAHVPASGGSETRSEGDAVICPRGWTLFDRKRRRPYVPQAWKTREEAEQALRELLRPYKPGSPWCNRLVVQWYQPKRGEPPADVM